MATASRPLRVANEAFLVASMIERCPKTMMLRELVMNAIEAAAAGPAPAAVRITPLQVGGGRKLAIWNTGEGMSPTELDGICDLASSLHKQTGLDQNFGMGAKVASLPSNPHGLRFRSCRNGLVSEVMLGRQDDVYGRLLHEGPEIIPGVADATAAAVVEGRALGADWTEVVLMGQDAGQDTVADPYAGNPGVSSDWVMQSLRQRFFNVPASLQILVGAGVGADQDRVFHPTAQSADAFDRSEAVVTRSGILVHYAFAANPARVPGAGSGMIVHSGEIYGLVEGTKWLLDAPSFGIPFGARLCRIIVELLPGFGVRSEAYRQFLRFREDDQRQVYLGDFAALVRASMPGWLADIIASLGPARPDYLGDINHELIELLTELEVAPRHRTFDHVRGEDEPDTAEETPEANSDKPPESKKVFEVPPKIIPLREATQIEEQDLAGLAARYVADTHELFVNVQYPALQALQARLLASLEAAPDQERAGVIANEIGEAVVVRGVARSLIHSLAKRAAGWNNEQIVRAQSPEALSLAADSCDEAYGLARERAAGLLGLQADVGPAAPSTAAAAALGRLVARLAEAKQAVARASTRKDAVPFLLRISELEVSRRNFTEAQDWALQAAKADPESPWAVRQLAVLAMRRGDFHTAERLLTEKLAPLAAPAGLFERMMSELHRERGDSAAAADWAGRASRAAPDDWGVALHLSYMLAHEGAAEQAEEAARRAAELAPGAVMPIRRLAELRLQARDFAGAEQLARGAIVADPQDPASLATLASVLQRAGRHADASEAIRAALDLAPAKPAPYLRQAGDIAFRAKHYEEAFDLVDTASIADPDDPWTHHLRSYISQETGDLQAAAASAARATLLATASQDVFMRREAELFAMMGSNEAALEKALEAVAHQPMDASNYITLADIQKRLKDIPAAQATLEQAMRQSKPTSGLLLRASELAASQQQGAKALTYAREATVLDKDNPWAFSHLSSQLHAAGDTAGAITAAHRAAQISGFSARIP